MENRCLARIKLIGTRERPGTVPGVPLKGLNNKKVNYYTCLCALLLQVSVKCSSGIQYGVIYLKTWGSTKGHVAFWTTEFLCFGCFVYSRTHPTPPSKKKLPSLPDHVSCVVCQVCLVGWSIGVGLSCVVIAV
jgi:hypothetical protein